MDFFELFRFKKEYRNLDIVRGFAVFIMILAHVIAFTSDDSNQILNILRSIGDTFAFTLFLGVSGSVKYISASKDNYQLITHRFLRIFQILVIYYILAFIPFIKNGSFFNEFFKVIFFINVPNYTEFLIPFFFYGVIFWIFPTFLKMLISHYRIVIGAIIVCLVLSYVIYPLNLGNETLNSWKALLFGGPGYYRFPIFTYFPIYLGGAYFQKVYSDKLRVIAYPYLITLVLISIMYVFLFQDFSRWPPSIGFLAAGFAFFMFLLFICRYIKFGILNILGRYPLSFLFLHLFILNVMDIWIYKNYNNIPLVLIIFAGIILLSLILNQTFNVIRERTKKEKTS